MPRLLNGWYAIRIAYLIAILVLTTSIRLAQGQTEKAGSDSQSRSVWDHVYSEEQAKRGQSTYLEECARCHSETLSGGESAPELVGEDFVSRWAGKTVGDLFERTKNTMPADSPGRLSNRQYLNILAFILQANHFPAGEKELDTDLGALKQIRIDRK